MKYFHITVYTFELLLKRKCHYGQELETIYLSKERLLWVATWVYVKLLQKKKVFWKELVEEEMFLKLLHAEGHWGLTSSWSTFNLDLSVEVTAMRRLASLFSQKDCFILDNYASSAGFIVLIVQRALSIPKHRAGHLADATCLPSGLLIRRGATVGMYVKACLGDVPSEGIILLCAAASFSTSWHSFK